MARTGRPPKSIEQHIRDGTLGTRQRAKTPLIIGGRKKPTCPKSLQGHARKGYKLMIDDLWDSGILDAADRVMVVAAAMHYGLAMDAREKIDKYGLIYPVTRGAKDGQPGHTVIEANPAVGILRESLTELRQCCDSLGIGPSSRARLAGLGVKSKAIEKEIPGLEQFHTIVTGQN